MNKAYWNRIGKSYSRQIFHAMESDRNGLLKQLILRHANPTMVAADFGCGTGQFLNLLSSSFGRVLAVDHSADLLAQAAARHRLRQNIEFYNCDLIRLPFKVGPADFALCVNVLIMEDHAARTRILQSMRRTQKIGGHLLLVVPSLESVFLTQQRLMEWNLHDGFTPRRAAAHRIPGLKKTALARLHEGIIPIDNIPTKHYLREELPLLLGRNGYDTEAIEKVEYDWDTEFTSPPCWMQAPHPWDWVVQAKKAARY